MRITKQTTGITLIEIVAVATLTSVLAWGAIHTLTTVAQEETLNRRLGSGPVQAPYLRLTGVLDHRLTQAWDFTLSTTTNSGTITQTLSLLNETGTTYATLTLVATNTVVNYTFADQAGFTNITQAPLTVTYGYTNSTSIIGPDYLITAASGKATWQIAPPFFATAATANFSSALGSSVTPRITALRTNQSALFQRGCRLFTLNPHWNGFR